MIIAAGEYTQDPTASVGRGINFAPSMSVNAPLGADALSTATWSVVSGSGTVTGTTVIGSVAAGLFTSGPAGTTTVFKCVGVTANGQTLPEYLIITGR